MLGIGKKTHLSTVITSINKIYKDATINGKLNPSDIYVLESIYKLLHGCDTALSNDQKQLLIALYNITLMNSKYICKSTIIEKNIDKFKSKFTQNEIEDCVSYPKYQDIYYWQEEDYTITVSDVIDASKLTGFTTGKLKDTIEVFNTGKLIPYTFIGRIGFFILDTKPTDVYKIYDIFDNDVTTGFTVTYIDEMNSTLLVSNSIYSYGDMTFKIKKI